MYQYTYLHCKPLLDLTFAESKSQMPEGLFQIQPIAYIEELGLNEKVNVARGRCIISTLGRDLEPGHLTLNFSFLDPVFFITVRMFLLK